MHLPRTLLLLALVVLTGATPLRRADLLSCLQTTGVSTLAPGADGFSDAATAFNLRLSFQPAAIVYPDSDAGASAVVKCAASTGYPVSARSGGHSYAAYGLGGADGFLVVDLSKFTNITVAADGVTAVVGTGNRLGDVAQGLWDQGERALPHGVCPYVGIGGHAAFGGYGYTSRQWGFTLDRMVGAHVVLANGTIVDVSSDNQPDLFWAIRGAAPSFGIALSYTFATLPAPPTTTFFIYSFSGNASTASSALKALQSFGPTADPKLGLELVLDSTLTWYFTGSYPGSSSDLQTALGPLLSQLTKPDSTDVRELAWIPYIEATGSGTLNTSQPDTHDTFYAKSAVVPSSAPLSDEAIDYFMGYLFTSGPSSNTTWFIEAILFGGNGSAISSVPSNATAYGNRDGLLAFQLYASSANYAPPYPQSGFDFVDGMVAKLSMGRSTVQPLGEYPNYVDDRLTDAQWQAGYYGANYQRLMGIKEDVDPNGVFAYPQAVGR